MSIFAFLMACGGNWIRTPRFSGNVADQISYAWDNLVEYFARHALSGTFEFGNTLSESEIALRAMARENRISRRMLAGALLEFHEAASQRKTRSRMCKSLSGIVYVFLNSRPDRPREGRTAELSLRCLVARSLYKDCSTVIGLGINVEPGPQGYAEDIAYLDLPDWTDELDSEAKRIQEELGYFARPEVSRRHHDEYPPD